MANEIIERHGDMGRYERLQLLVQDDGDVCVAVINEKGHMAEVEFCSIGSGGGRSPNTKKALFALIEAIRQDNETNPIR